MNKNTDRNYMLTFVADAVKKDPSLYGDIIRAMDIDKCSSTKYLLQEKE